jgi:predicted kinase
MKLVAMRGLPASGKSSKAKEIIKGGGEFYRVNRDLLREMLHHNIWTGKREGVTVDAAQMLVANLLQQDKNVIVDDTNLGDKHIEMWKMMAQQFGAKFEIIDMMKETDVTECITRDAARTDKNPVGKAVIMNMAVQYDHLNLDKIVVCDIDGTVADCKHRLHHLQGEKKDWKGFFSEMDKDTPRKDVYKNALNDAKAHDAQLLFVSARPEDYREVTEQWLRDNGMDSYTHLIMRRKGDKRPDTEVKFDIYKQYLKQYDIIKVIDDRPAVIEMWREQGLEVEDVGEGKDF